MQYRIKCVGRIASEEVSSRGSAVTMQNGGSFTIQQASKFGDDFCEQVSESTGYKNILQPQTLTLGILVGPIYIVASDDDHRELETLHV